MTAIEARYQLDEPLISDFPSCSFVYFVVKKCKKEGK